MKQKSNVPYSVVTEGSLDFYHEDLPLWVIVLMARVHHFNSRRNEKYALYLDKDSVKLRVRPEDLIGVLAILVESGDLTVDKVNTGLYLLQLSDTILKKLDLLA